jgi:hypothetical protein
MARTDRKKSVSFISSWSADEGLETNKINGVRKSEEFQERIGQWNPGGEHSGFIDILIRLFPLVARDGPHMSECPPRPEAARTGQGSFEALYAVHSRISSWTTHCC